MDKAAFAEIMNKVFHFRREAIQRACPEIIRLDVDPAGRMLAILSDASFAALTPERIRYLKGICYRHVQELDKDGVIPPQAFFMCFDSDSSYHEFGSSYYYYRSDNPLHQIKA